MHEKNRSHFDRSIAEFALQAKTTFFGRELIKSKREELIRRVNEQLEQMRVEVIDHLKNHFSNIDWSDSDAVRHISAVFVRELAGFRENYLQLMRSVQRTDAPTVWSGFVKKTNQFLAQLADEMHSQWREQGMLAEIGAQCACAVSAIKEPREAPRAIVADLALVDLVSPEALATRQIIATVLYALEADNAVSTLGGFVDIARRVDELAKQVEQFRGDLTAATELLDEQESRSQSRSTQPVTIAPVQRPEEIIADHFRQLRESGAAQLAMVRKELAPLQTFWLEICGWLEEARGSAKAAITKARLCHSAEEPEIVLAQTRMTTAIAEVERKHELIGERVKTLERIQNELRGQLDALRVVAGGGPIQVPTLEASFDYELPDIDALLAFDKTRQKEVPEVVVSPDTIATTVPPAPPVEQEDELREPDTESVPRMPIFDPDGVARVGGLNYTVGFTQRGLEAARAYEAAITSLCGLTPTDLCARLPWNKYTGPSTHRDYYDELIGALPDGTFLSNLKIAIIVLNALRKKDALAARTSNTIGIAMIRKNVALAKKIGPVTSATIRTLLCSVIFSAITEKPAIVERVIVGSKWGPGNALTSFGSQCAQVWTWEALQTGAVSHSQLNAIWENAQQMLVRYEEG